MTQQIERTPESGLIQMGFLRDRLNAPIEEKFGERESLRGGYLSTVNNFLEALFTKDFSKYVTWRDEERHIPKEVLDRFNAVRDGFLFDFQGGKIVEIVRSLKALKADLAEVTHVNNNQGGKIQSLTQELRRILREKGLPEFNFSGFSDSKDREADKVQKEIEREHGVSLSFTENAIKSFEAYLFSLIKSIDDVVDVYIVTAGFKNPRAKILQPGVDEDFAMKFGAMREKFDAFLAMIGKKKK